MANWYYYNENGGKIGPIRGRELIQLVQQGTITQETLIENESGRVGPAKNAKGLKFPEAIHPEQNPFTLLDNPFIATPPINQTMLQSNSVPVATGSKALVLGSLLILLIISGIVWWWIKSDRSPFTQNNHLNLGDVERMRTCSNNLTHIMLALLNYESASRGLPPLCTVDNNGKPLHSWRVLILPLMEQSELHRQIRLNEPWDSPHNRQFHDQIPSIYQCPNNPGGCCYSGIAGEGFVPAKEANTRTGAPLTSIKDGTNNTLAVIEVEEPFCWMDPTADITLDELARGINVANGRVGSSHPGNGCHAAMFDGSVRFLPQTIDKSVLRAIGTRDGGESVSLPR